LRCLTGSVHLVRKIGGTADACQFRKGERLRKEEGAHDSPLANKRALELFETRAFEKKKVPRGAPWSRERIDPTETVTMWLGDPRMIGGRKVNKWEKRGEEALGEKSPVEKKHSICTAQLNERQKWNYQVKEGEGKKGGKKDHISNFRRNGPCHLSNKRAWAIKS